MKTIAVGWILSLLTLSAWAGTFVETFNDDGWREWEELTMTNHEIAKATWEVVDREIQGVGPTWLVSLLTIGDETWVDYTIEFDVKPIKRHGTGSIAIAARRNENSIITCVVGDMRFPLPERKALCFRGDFHENIYVVIDSVDIPMLLLDTWFHLKLSVREATFTFFINDEQVLEVNDEEGKFLTGGAGFGIGNYTARFDNIVISGEGIPDKGKLAVTARSKLATTWGRLKVF